MKLSFALAATQVLAHNRYSNNYANLKLRQQRKSYCTLLSFNGSKRNPSPVQCEQAARNSAILTCDALKAGGFAPASDDNRCLTILKDISKIRRQDCSSEYQQATPLFSRVLCARFGEVNNQQGDVYSIYDVLEAVPYLDKNSANFARYASYKQGDSSYSYFTNGWWVFERETRCHGLITTFIVQQKDPACVEYYNDENTAVCNYLKTIFDDLWDLGCKRTRKLMLDVGMFHCSQHFVVGRDGSAKNFCRAKGDGEDVECDAFKLICENKTSWDIDDVALAPYFLNDAVIDNLLKFRSSGSSALRDIYTAGKENDAGLPLQASVDYLQHVIKKWIPKAGRKAAVVGGVSAGAGAGSSGGDASSQDVVRVFGKFVANLAKLLQ